MDIKEEINKVRWHHRFQIAPGIETPGAYNPSGLFSRLNLPDDLSGLRVLDIGARDGFFSFTIERRGASVVAVDFEPAESMGFGIASRYFKSSARFIQANLYDLPNLGLGKFDLVLFLGVIYHIPDPYLGLEIVRGLVNDGGKVYLEANNLDTGFKSNKGEEIQVPEIFKDFPLALFTRANRTNYWCMNANCLRNLATDTAFTVEREETWGHRIMLELKAVNSPATMQTMKLNRGIVH